MANARSKFRSNIAGVRAAISEHGLASGAASTTASPATKILRRGIAITAMVTLEAFVRERTEELLCEFQNWPGSFSELPEKLQKVALVESLGRLENHARLLRSAREDYQSLVFEQTEIISNNTAGCFGLSRYISGDYTGNISTDSIRDLASYFKIAAAWQSFDTYCRAIGFGVPSLQASADNLIRNRHRSAHNDEFSPTASDVSEAPNILLAIAICIDCSISTSVRHAINRHGEWKSRDCDWMSLHDLFFLEPSNGSYKLKKPDAQRALRVLSADENAASYLPAGRSHHPRVIITQDASKRPIDWTVV